MTLERHAVCRDSDGYFVLRCFGHGRVLESSRGSIDVDPCGAFLKLYPEIAIVRIWDRRKDARAQRDSLNTQYRRALAAVRTAD